MLAGVATLREIERFWSLDDVYRCNALLDRQDAFEAAAIERAKRKRDT